MNTADISANQLGLLWHTLGIRPEDRNRRTVTRNYFLTSPSYDDANNLDVLVAAGLMACGKPPAFCDQSEVVYRATQDGERVALGKLPPLPKLTRYEQFLDADIDCTFAEWLGIENPKLEFSGRSVGKSRASMRAGAASGGAIRRTGSWATWTRKRPASCTTRSKSFGTSRTQTNAGITASC
jgi:hypothetical protein